jgi:hypothetical protein
VQRRLRLQLWLSPPVVAQSPAANTAVASGSTVTISISTGPSNQNPAGVYSGTIAENGVSVSVIAMVSPNGQYLAQATNLSNQCADVSTGQLTVTGNTFTGSGVVYFTSASVTAGCTDPDGSTQGTWTVTGSFVQGVSATVTFVDTTANGTVTNAPTETINTSSLYNQPSSLADVTGNWTTLDGTTVSVTSNGTVSAQDATNGCVINGTVSIINASFNLYSVSFAYASCTGSNAGLNGQTLNGLGYLSTSTTFYAEQTNDQETYIDYGSLTKQ